MPKVKPKLKASLIKLQQEKQYRGKINSLPSHPYSKSKIKHKSTFVKPLPPPLYKPEDKILLVGEGNFSFANSLATNILYTSHFIIATCLDSEEILNKKYDDAKQHIQSFIEFGGKVIYEVDATQLEKCKLLKGKRFDKIIFNFPHAGLGIKDQDRNILSNQKLLKAFFNSAIPFLSSKSLYSDMNDGEIHVTMKTVEPYNQWNVKQLAKSTGHLAIKESIDFIPNQYPGYEHRRTLGYQQGKSKNDNDEIFSKKPKTIIIARKESLELEKQQREAAENTRVPFIVD
ncbi:2964_t:CDS:2 [Funneliformis geosporum]|uniref:3525_t:CDS:1 n=1 Tax=Funneliformis geosporum TaxID=1117311 RepID=A0A9W4SPW9_9GLOM|nr:2964_t:CDS:2 [Funneliformis geosporum]CAI2176175.1 3525_t:CDS:2 [Funneliformis geosporum]